MADEKEIQGLPDRIYDNFVESTVFITGGTGYLGKVLIERALRVLDVKKVYLLIRSKKNKSPQVRLREIFANPLFQKLRDLKGEKIFEKCVGMEGNITKTNLDLSEENREILKSEVEYVIHSAATVRFDEPLRQALLINTKGVQLMLQLAKEMRKLKCFAHISTTFCHPEVKVLEEKVYRSKRHPERLIELIDWFDDETIGSMTKTLLGGVPNAYTFSKALGEDLVADAMDTIPAII
ncbi:epimerase, partial [Oryctes borbonicus]